MTPAVRVSVVIPTHDRSKMLLGTLDSLCRQTCPPDNFEVIVVADGCTDDTAQVVSSLSVPFRLVFIEQPGMGPSFARNRGVECASGDLLLFLDDDIEAWPELLEAHLAAAGSTGPRAVIGYLPTVLDQQQGYFRVELGRWWENMFAAMRVPGYRLRYSSLLTGNFSIPSEVFRRLGGFNTALRCHEDYEFGYRLIRAGIELAHEPRAGGYHHETSRLERSLDRKVEEGQADVFLARLYPELLPGLPLSSLFDYGDGVWRSFFRLAFQAPALGDRLAGLARALLPGLERLGLRGRWRKMVDRLLVYWYLRGVSRIVGNLAGWASFLAEIRARIPPPQPPVTLDLSAGVEAAGQLLDECRPDAVRVCFGEKEVGLSPSLPGAVPLRARHLPRILQEDLGWELMGVLFPARAAGEDSEHARLMADLFARWRKGVNQ